VRSPAQEREVGGDGEFEVAHEILAFHGESVYIFTQEECPNSEL
jgi:hypothetical protein